MSDPLSEAYFHWLVPQVREDTDHQRVTYYDVLLLLYEKEFVWIVPNDDNRVQDGLDLRTEFAYDGGHSKRRIAGLGPCSVLEVLIGLSRRLSFMAGGSPEGWAWQLLDNLELTGMTDPLSKRKGNRVNEILDVLIWRTYSPNGEGGFFPLAYPDEDQTKIEMWYQMSAYVDEIHPEF